MGWWWRSKINARGHRCYPSIAICQSWAVFWCFGVWESRTIGLQTDSWKAGSWPQGILFKEWFTSLSEHFLCLDRTPSQQCQRFQGQTQPFFPHWFTTNSFAKQVIYRQKNEQKINKSSFSSAFELPVLTMWLCSTVDRDEPQFTLP